MTQLLAHLFGDYILQSDWMAQNKTKRSWPAFIHALTYSLCFLPLCWVAAHSVDFQSVTFTPAADSGSPFVTVPGIAIAAGRWLVLTGREGFHWKAWAVIFGTHLLIDRFRLARYVVWAKNWLGSRELWTHVGIGDEVRWVKEGQVTASRPEVLIWQRIPLAACPTGYPPSTPVWLATWLLIIADNTLHLAINYFALKYL